MRRGLESWMGGVDLLSNKVLSAGGRGEEAKKNARFPATNESGVSWKKSGRQETREGGGREESPSLRPSRFSFTWWEGKKRSQAAKTSDVAQFKCPRRPLSLFNLPAAAAVQTDPF